MLEPLSAFLTAGNTKTRGPLAVVEPTQQCAVYSFSRGNPTLSGLLDSGFGGFLTLVGRALCQGESGRGFHAGVDEVAPFSLWQETMFSAPASLPGA